MPQQHFFADSPKEDVGLDPAKVQYASSIHAEHRRSQRGIVALDAGRDRAQWQNRRDAHRWQRGSGRHHLKPASNLKTFYVIFS